VLGLVDLPGFMVPSVRYLFFFINEASVLFRPLHKFYMNHPLQQNYRLLLVRSQRFPNLSPRAHQITHIILLSSVRATCLCTSSARLGPLTPRCPHEIRIRRSFLPRNRSSNRLLSILLRNLLCNPSIRQKR